MTEQHHTTSIRGAIGIVLMAVLAACGPTEATPTTTTAPPSTTTPPTTTTTPPTTTAAPATTATPTTAAATTALATRAPSTNTPVAESPETEVGNRVIQIFDRYYECLSAPPECDPNQIAQDYTPNSPTFQRRSELISEFQRDGYKADRLDLRRMWMIDAQIGEAGEEGVLQLCEQDGAMVVDAESGEALDDKLVWRLWTVTVEFDADSNSWLLFDAFNDKFDDPADTPCAG